MNKAVIYTSLTGGYDNLPQYEVIDPDFDYICFSNDFKPGEKVGQWEIRPIPIEIKDRVRLSRYVKLMPHTVFPDYEYSIWLDANLVITDQSIYDIIKKHINNGEKWCAIKHPFRDCLYDDARECIKNANVKYDEVAPQILFLKAEKYPKHNGLYENNFILRQHNDIEIISIDAKWWELYLRFSRRDQLSLCYVFWKQSFQPSFLLPPETCTRNISGMTYMNHKIQSIPLRLKRKLIYWNNCRKLKRNNIFES